VDRKEIGAADWSLTPAARRVARGGRRGLDFEQTLRDIHTELADLDRERRIWQENPSEFEELGI